ncbi:hypothetical protein ACLI4Z_16025 [Natrialbaceae archaeon A-arb3/5]
MRRIDDSRALERDEDDPFVPSNRDGGSESRTIDWTAFSHAFVPTALRARAIAVDVSTDRKRYDIGEPVQIRIEFRNRLPFPIRLRTDSPNVWTWAVDDVPAASTLSRDVPDRPSTFSFARRERKRFTRQWPQRIRVSEDEWEAVGSGTYTISARIARTDADDRALRDRATIEIVD